MELLSLQPGLCLRGNKTTITSPQIATAQEGRDGRAHMGTAERRKQRNKVRRSQRISVSVEMDEKVHCHTRG